MLIKPLMSPVLKYLFPISFPVSELLILIHLFANSNSVWQPVSVTHKLADFCSFIAFKAVEDNAVAGSTLVSINGLTFHS